MLKRLGLKRKEGSSSPRSKLKSKAVDSPGYGTVGSVRTLDFERSFEARHIAINPANRDLYIASSGKIIVAQYNNGK